MKSMIIQIKTNIKNTNNHDLPLHKMLTDTFKGMKSASLWFEHRREMLTDSKPQNQVHVVE